MIKALITIYDDESGKIYEKDKMIEPKIKTDIVGDITIYTSTFYAQFINYKINNEIAKEV